MAKKFYKFNLDETNVVSAQFLAERGSVREFVVKYRTTIQRTVYEVTPEMIAKDPPLQRMVATFEQELVQRG